MLLDKSFTLVYANTSTSVNTSTSTRSATPTPMVCPVAKSSSAIVLKSLFSVAGPANLT